MKKIVVLKSSKEKFVGLDQVVTSIAKSFGDFEELKKIEEEMKKFYWIFVIEFYQIQKKLSKKLKKALEKISKSLINWKSFKKSLENFEKKSSEKAKKNFMKSSENF